MKDDEYLLPGPAWLGGSLLVTTTYVCLYCEFKMLYSVTGHEIYKHLGFKQNDHLNGVYAG